MLRLDPADPGQRGPGQVAAGVGGLLAQGRDAVRADRRATGSRPRAPCGPPTRCSPTSRPSLPGASGTARRPDGCCRSAPPRARPTDRTRSIGSGPGRAYVGDRRRHAEAERQPATTPASEAGSRGQGDRRACREIRNGGTSTVRISIDATTQPTAFAWPVRAAVSETGVPRRGRRELPPAVFTVLPAGAPGEWIDGSWIRSRSRVCRCRAAGGARSPRSSRRSGWCRTRWSVPPEVVGRRRRSCSRPCRTSRASCTCRASGPSAGC